MHMCVKESVDGRVSKDDCVSTLWYLWLMCKSHPKHKWALTSFHIAHHTHIADVLQHCVPSHTMCLFTLWMIGATVCFQWMAVVCGVGVIHTVCLFADAYANHCP